MTATDAANVLMIKVMGTNAAQTVDLKVQNDEVTACLVEVFCAAAGSEAALSDELDAFELFEQ